MASLRRATQPPNNAPFPSNSSSLPASVAVHSPYRGRLSSFLALTRDSQSAVQNTVTSNPVLINTKKNTNKFAFDQKTSSFEAKLGSLNNKSAPTPSSKGLSPIEKGKDDMKKVRGRSSSLTDLKDSKATALLLGKDLQITKKLPERKYILPSGILPHINNRKSSLLPETNLNKRIVLNTINTADIRNLEENRIHAEARIVKKGVKMTKESEVVKDHISWIIKQIQKLSTDNSVKEPNDEKGNLIPLIQQTNLDGGDTLIVSLLKNNQPVEEKEEEKGFIVRLKWIKQQLEESEVKLWEYSEAQKALLDRIKFLQIDLDNEKSRSASLSKQLQETIDSLRRSKDSADRHRKDAINNYNQAISLNDKEFQVKLFTQEQMIRNEMKQLDIQLQHSQASLIETQQQLLEVERSRDQFKYQCNAQENTVSNLRQEIIVLEEQINIAGHTNITMNSLRAKIEKELDEKTRQQLQASEADMKLRIQQLEKSYLLQIGKLNDEHLKRDKEWVLRSTQDELKYKEVLLRWNEMEKKLLKREKEVEKYKEQLEKDLKIQTDHLIEAEKRMQKIESEFTEKISSAQAWYERQIGNLNNENYRLNALLLEKDHATNEVDEDSHNNFQVQITRLQAGFDEQIMGYQKEIAKLKALTPPNNVKTADVHKEYQEKMRLLQASHQEEISILKEDIHSLQNSESDGQRVQDIHTTYQERISKLQAMYEEQFRKNNEEISRLNHEIENPRVARKYEVTTQTDLPGGLFQKPLWCCYWYCRCFGFTSKKISPDEEVEITKGGERT